MDVRLFIEHIFLDPTRTWIREVRPPSDLRSPDHRQIEPQPLNKKMNIEAFMTKVNPRKSIAESSLPAIESLVPSEKGMEENDFIISADELMEYKNDVDWLITTGVDLKCLSNPLNYPTIQWTRNMIELWLCRYPMNENQNVNLVRVTHFRRYGMRRQFEVECTFQYPGGHNKNGKQRKFWIHICLLYHTPTYRKMIGEKYHWDWRNIEYNFNEMLEGYGSDQDDIRCTPKGEVYAVKKSKKKKITPPINGNSKKI